MEADMNLDSLRMDALPAAPYSNRTPEAPYIHVPAVTNLGVGHTGMVITPSFENTDSSQLTEDDIKIITCCAGSQSASDTTRRWKYAMRRDAQPVLDFLYLGPSSVARDREFLTNNNITMVLAVRDARFETNVFQGGQRLAESLGLTFQMFDIPSNQDLIRAFPLVIRAINSHLIQVYRSQAQNVDTNPRTGSTGKVAIIDPQSFKHGKVLLVCETGNERSATAAAAYVMSVYGLDHITAMQFVTLQRFCVVFGEDAKQLLQSYNDILTARRDVSLANNSNNASNAPGSFKAIVKRTIEEFSEKGGYEPENREGGGGDGGGNAAAATGASTQAQPDDSERYQGRYFSPFVDRARGG